MKCGSVHIWSDAKCVRSHGHDGYCHSRFQMDRDGVMKRAVWLSKDGAFKSHHAYEQGRVSALSAKEAE